MLTFTDFHDDEFPVSLTLTVRVEWVRLGRLLVWWILPVKYVVCTHIQHPGPGPS